MPQKYFYCMWEAVGTLSHDPRFFTGTLNQVHLAIDYTVCYKFKVDYRSDQHCEVVVNYT